MVQPQGGGNFKAWMKGNDKIWGVGYSEDEAIGKMIRNFPESGFTIKHVDPAPIR